jgi:acyl transferase domain-containing protein
MTDHLDPAAARENMTARIRENPIAIVGMSCLMPDALSLPEFWSNIVDRVDSIVDVPPSRWHIDEYYDNNPRNPDKVYSKRGAFLPELQFNPMDWGLPPNLLEATDTSQLLSLVVAKDCLEDARIFADSHHDRERIGVVLGVGGGLKSIGPLVARLQAPLLERVLRAHGIAADKRSEIAEAYLSHYPKWEENTFPGLLGNVVAGRIANRLNLGGLNFTTDAACASSLSALRMAVHELLDGNCDVMLSGGVCTDNSIFTYMSFSRTPALTLDEKVRPFDRKSSGMLVGEGIGMIALKRLADAERDGDRVYAVVRGLGASSDGRYKSIYAPYPEGQARALRAAYREAAIEPDTVELIEAHGTGTLAGDVAELEGLSKLFAARTPPEVAIGSVKSQVGHLKAAAGIAGVIKTALALHHKVLPPTINVDEPTENLRGSAFYLNTRARPWIARPDGTPRRAGVSAFGFGGTNFHVVLEEHTSHPYDAYRLSLGHCCLLLDAANPRELSAECTKLRAQLEAATHRPELAALARAHTLRPLARERARAAFVGRRAEELLDQLDALLAALAAEPTRESWESPNGAFYRAHGEDFQGRVAALFPGQGSQFANMAIELANDFPPLREAIETIDKLAVQAGLERVSAALFPIPGFDAETAQSQEETLRQTQRAQPALAAVSAGMFALARAAGLSPDFVAGHSFGELTALWAAGALDTTAFFKLALERGQALAGDATRDSGAMAAVVGDIETLTSWLTATRSPIRIANYNSPTQVVIAGASSELERCVDALSRDHGRAFQVRRLPVSAAFHTPLVERAQQPFAAACARADWSEPGLPVYSNVTGERHDADPAAIRSALISQLIEPIRFQAQIERMYEAGARVFVEIGPKDVLTQLVKDTLGARPHLAVALHPSPKRSAERQLRLALARLAVAGVQLEEPDRYAAVLRPTHTYDKSPLRIKLSAPNHKSKESVAAEAKYRLEPSGNPAPETKPASVASVALSTARPAAPARGTADRQVTLAPVVRAATVEASTLEPTSVLGADGPLARFYECEQQALRVHEKYLEGPREYVQAFVELTKSISQAGDGISERLAESVSALHAHQCETLRVHDGFLNQHSEVIRASLDLMGQRYVAGATLPRPSSLEPDPGSRAASFVPTPAEVAHIPVAVEPAAQAPRSAAENLTQDLEALGQRMLAIVADKTGYPAEMLELGMDMESDLGIDSIKRVEILGAVQADIPGLPELDPMRLAEMRTLGEVAQYLKDRLTDRDALAPAPTLVVTSAPHAPSSPAISTASVQTSSGVPALDLEAMSRAILDIVSAKTGYPSEMLTLDMDMEADLGIDSIKRVEILGAVLETYPNLPQPDTQVLAEQRTLRQVADHFLGLISGAAAPTEAIAAHVEKEPAASALPVCRRPRLKHLAPPDRLVQAAPEHGAVCLLASDGSVLTEQVCAKLLADGFRVALATLDSDDAVLRPIAGVSVHRCAGDPSELQRMVELVVAELGPIDVYIDLLRPSGRLPLLSAAWDARKARIRSSFQLAKLLKPMLTQPRVGARRALLTVVRIDGRFGLAGGDACALDYGLFGMTKSLGHEWPSTFCRALDLAPELTVEAAAQHVLDELYDPQRSVFQTGAYPGGRCTLVPNEQLELLSSDRPLRRETAVLVSGGARGVTSACVLELARRYQCGFIIVGRSEIESSEPHWAEGRSELEDLNRSAMKWLTQVADTPTPLKVQQLVAAVLASREARAVLAEIERVGGRVAYVACDVRQTAQLVRQVRAASERIGPIVGLIHGAGVLADKWIEKKTVQDFDRVVDTKVDGLGALLQCVDESALTHVALFASAAGFYGNQGQTDYALANECLNGWALTFQRAHPSCSLVSFNWGPWDGGMVSPGLRRILAEHHVPLISQQGGATVCADALTAAPSGVAPQLLAGAELPAQQPVAVQPGRVQRVQRRLRIAWNPTINDHCIAGVPVLPAASVVTWFANSCEDLYPGWRFWRIEDFKLFKGVVFDRQLPECFELCVTELETVDGQVRLESRLTAKNAAGRTQPYYSARCVMRRGDAAERPQFDAFDLTPDEGLSAGSPYEDGTLFHGPYYRTIHRILNLNHQGMTVECRTAPLAEDVQGQFLTRSFDPYRSDAGLQTVLIWVRKMYGAASLPTALDAGEMYCVPQPGLPVYMTMQVVSASASTVSADIFVHDEHGKLFGLLRGARVVVSARLNELFGAESAAGARALSDASATLG